MELQILEQNDNYIVCVKPAGLAVQTARASEQDMESLLRNMFHGEAYVIHRLDQPVEGIMVWALNQKEAAYLSGLVSQNKMSKKYLACVWNDETNPIPDEGELNDYIRKDGRSNTSAIVDSKAPGGKLSKLKFRVIKRNSAQVLVEVKLITGRHHQIRLQFANAGWPLVGDRKYGCSAEKINKCVEQSVENGVEKNINNSEEQGINTDGEKCINNIDAQDLKTGGKMDKEPLHLCAYKLEFTDRNGKHKNYEIKPTWSV